MPIRSLADVQAAHDAGRVHVQRFYKGSLVNLADSHWQDWAYAPGQPAYDARIGIANEFNPFVATRNDAIWFPDIGAGQHRYLSEVVLRTQASNTGQIYTDGVVYDLLGVYPLIDGDSTDIQAFTNDNPLPRYVDGVGVFPVLVNHIAPIVAAAPGIVTYTDHNDVERAISFRASLTGAGRVCSCGNNGSAASIGPISLPLTAGSRGVKNITSIQFTSAPGGLYAIYLYKPLTTIINNDGFGETQKLATVKPMLQRHAWHMPRIYDGAHLGMFLRTGAGGRAIASIYGHMEFIWG